MRLADALVSLNIPYSVSYRIVCRLRQVHVRVLQNTVEQFVVSFVAQVATSTWLSASQMMTIPIVVVLFVVGRLVYWRGYLNPAYNRTGRAAGLPLTMFPTMAMLVFTIYKLVITTVGFV